MPSAVRGIGTAWCGRLHAIQWELDEEPDRDSVECIVLLSLPVLPLRAVHTYDWYETDDWDEEAVCRVLKRRWSWDLLLTAFGRRWLTAVLVLCVIGPVMWGVSLAGHDLSLLRPGLWISGSAVAAAAAGAGLWALGRLGRRGTDIRLVIGPQDCGSCDPAVWNRALQAANADPVESYGTRSFTEAAAAALDRGQFARAMCAARLAAAAGEHDGETATDRVLSHPEVAAALPALREQPWRRWAILPEAPPDAEQQAELDRLAEEAAREGPACDNCGERAGADAKPFYDGRIHCTACIERVAGEDAAEAFADLPPLQAIAPRNRALMVGSIVAGIGSFLVPPLVIHLIDADPTWYGWIGMGLILTGGGIAGLRRRVGLRRGVLMIGSKKISLDHVTRVRVSDRRLTVSWMPKGHASVRIRGPQTRTIAAAMAIIDGARD